MNTVTVKDEKVLATDKQTLLHWFENERILLIGGTGSLGTHLLITMQAVPSCTLFVVSRDENKHWHLKRKFPNVQFFLGDIRNKKRIKDLLTIIRPTVVILCSALKHIDQCESQMEECIATNLIGTENVLKACVEFSQLFPLKSFLFISTDKACSPVNVYGLSKAISERFVTQIAYKYSTSLFPSKTKFLCVRYGNVINSRGSLVPKLIELSINPKIASLPLTNAHMTRFFMTLDQSIELILHTLIFGNCRRNLDP